MERMYEISFERQADGAIRLEQQNVSDAPGVICLHPEQLRFIARRMADYKEADAQRVADLERCVAVLASRIEGIVNNDEIRGEIANRCHDGLWMLSQLDGLLDLAVEFDGHRLLPGLLFSPRDHEPEPTPASTESGRERFVLTPN